MVGQSLEMLASLGRRREITSGRSRERPVEMVFSLFKESSHCVQQGLCLGGRCYCLLVVTRIKPCLQLSNPIPGVGPKKTFQMPLETGLVEPILTERAKHGG